MRLRSRMPSVLLGVPDARPGLENGPLNVQGVTIVIRRSRHAVPRSIVERRLSIFQSGEPQKEVLLLVSAGGQWMRRGGGCV